MDSPIMIPKKAYVPGLSPKATHIADGIANASHLRVAKYRTTVNRRNKPAATSKAPAAAILAFSLAPQRLFAMDLSVARTGWAVGTPGQAPVNTGVVIPPKKLTEGQRFAFIADQLVQQFKFCKGTMAAFWEFERFPYAASARASGGIRGAVMAAFGRIGVDAFPLHEGQARKDYGVDMRRRQPNEHAQLYMKHRVARALKLKLNLELASHDEADAVLLLVTSPRYLRSPA